MFVRRLLEERVLAGDVAEVANHVLALDHDARVAIADRRPGALAVVGLVVEEPDVGDSDQPVGDARREHRHLRAEHADVALRPAAEQVPRYSSDARVTADDDVVQVRAGGHIHADLLGRALRERAGDARHDVLGVRLVSDEPPERVGRQIEGVGEDLLVVEVVQVLALHPHELLSDDVRLVAAAAPGEFDEGARLDEGDLERGAERDGALRRLEVPLDVAGSRVAGVIPFGRLVGFEAQVEAHVRGAEEIAGERVDVVLAQVHPGLDAVERAGGEEGAELAGVVAARHLGRGAALHQLGGEVLDRCRAPDFVLQPHFAPRRRLWMMLPSLSARLTTSSFIGVLSVCSMATGSTPSFRATAAFAPDMAIEFCTIMSIAWLPVFTACWAAKKLSARTCLSGSSGAGIPASMDSRMRRSRSAVAIGASGLNAMSPGRWLSAMSVRPIDSAVAWAESTAGDL